MNINNNGYMRRQALAKFREKGITPFREMLSPEDFLEVGGKTIKRKTRRRVFIPELVIWIMIWSILKKETWNTTLRSQMRQTGGLGEIKVSEGAFHKARKKIPLSFFLELYKHTNKKYEQQYGERMKYKGRRLVAWDGMPVDLPVSQAVRKHYGGVQIAGGKEGRMPQAKVVGFINLESGMVLDYWQGPNHKSEQEGMKQVIKKVRGNDIVLYDGGFYAYTPMVVIMRRKADFLVRVSSRVMEYGKLTMKGTDEWQIEFKISNKTRRKHPELPERMTLRLIRYEKKGFRPAYLLTSLKAEQFPREEIVELYHRRWGIETVYRELKEVLTIENLRSQSVTGIKKEIAVQLILNNLIRWVMTEANSKDERVVDFSFKEAKTCVLDFIDIMERVPLTSLWHAYRMLLAHVRKAKILKRPGRSYPRVGKKNTHKLRGDNHVPLSKVA